MEFWAGELNRSYIKKINHTKVMDSAASFIPRNLNCDIEKYNVPKINYSYESFFLDNGAFSLLKNANRSVSNKKIKAIQKFVLKTQRSIQPEFTVPFDFPFSPGMTRIKMEKEWKRTQDNVEIWESECSKINLIPALHAWNLDSLRKNIKWIIDRNYNTAAVGSLITLDVDLKGFFGDRQPTKNLFESFLVTSHIAKEFGVQIHIFGLGSSPLMYHLANYCGIDSSDSSGYRRKAAYGKIILPQTGERYAGNGTATFGVNNKKSLTFRNIFSESEKMMLTNCKCPECRKISKHPYRRWKHLSSNWEFRAIHNKWVMDQEVLLAKEFKKGAIEEYENFLDLKCNKSRFYKPLWKYIKKRQKEISLDI